MQTTTTNPTYNVIEGKLKKIYVWNHFCVVVKERDIFAHWRIATTLWNTHITNGVSITLKEKWFYIFIRVNWYFCVLHFHKRMFHNIHKTWKHFFFVCFFIHPFSVNWVTATFFSFTTTNTGKSFRVETVSCYKMFSCFSLHTHHLYRWNFLLNHFRTSDLLYLKGLEYVYGKYIKD